jgi:hypothetical protein
MNIIVSPQLQNFVLEVREKGNVTLKEILILKWLLSDKRKWVILTDNLMDSLFIIGTIMVFQLPRKILGIEDNILFYFLTTGLVYGANKLFWSFIHCRNLYRNLKSIGVTCSEIETVSTNLSLVGSRHSAANFLSISYFLFSAKTQKEIFEPIASDWQEEYFEALFKKEIWKERWINVRYTYAFLAAMWQKSPIGDLIEFISKLAK